MADQRPHDEPHHGEAGGPGEPGSVVVPDPCQLRALAHPLRLRLLGLLRAHGPSTASRLAARVDDSSGSTSYHLRQLAAAGLVLEDPDHAGAGGRERWWRAAHASTYLEARRLTGDDLVVSVDYLRAVAAVYATKVQEWLAAELDAPPEWREASTLSDVRVSLPPAAAAELGEALVELAQEAERRHAGHPDARPVAVQVQVLPQLPASDLHRDAEAGGEAGLAEPDARGAR